MRWRHGHTDGRCRLALSTLTGKTPWETNRTKSAVLNFSELQTTTVTPGTMALSFLPTRWHSSLMRAISTHRPCAG